MVLDLVTMLTCAAAFYYVGRTEYRSGLLLAASSVITWLLVTRWLGGGWWLAVGGQALLFGALSAWSAWYIER